MKTTYFQFKKEETIYEEPEHDHIYEVCNRFDQNKKIEQIR